ncbi:MAG: polyprenol monophosphomannose synthase [Thermoanaerobaculia bacterium]|nr:polyprenol monophosphomannose synthase [Thermoanaerobaculia bacterium]
MHPSLSIVVPTFLEAESLARLVPALFEELEPRGYQPEVIVVDDGSTDGTPDVARDLAQSYAVRLIERQDRRGLATAVIEGFDASRADVLVVLDADGSHPVSAIPKLVDAVGSGEFAIAVGSRHAEGGGFREWPLFSRLKSRFAAFFARGLTDLRDPTSGFMAVRRDLYETLELDPIGWKIVLEVVVRAAPAPWVEIPIIFEKRTHGVSKQTPWILLQYWRHCIRLYRHRKRVARLHGEEPSCAS